MTFQDRSEVTTLLDGLEVLELHEAKRDGEAYSGPKHWHTYDILAASQPDTRIPATKLPAGEDTPRGRSGHSCQARRCIKIYGLAACLLGRSRDCQWCE